MDFKKLDTSKAINISTNVFCSFILLVLIASFAQYYSMRLKFDNPLIPEVIVKISTRPYLIKGFVLLVGLLLVLFLKSFQKNLGAFLLAIILIAYFILSKNDPAVTF